MCEEIVENGETLYECANCSEEIESRFDIKKPVKKIKNEV